MDSLISYGNHAQDIEVIWHRVKPWRHLAVYDDDPATGKPKPPDDLSGRILIGVNNSRLRQDIGNRLGLPGCDPLVDPDATIGPNVTIGFGSVVAAQTALTHSVSLGNHVHVNTCVSLVRAFVGDYSTLSPGCTICGNVTIGEATSIGANATVCERVTIGNNVIIGAGAIVPPYSTVPDGATVIGIWKGQK